MVHDPSAAARAVTRALEEVEKGVPLADKRLLELVHGELKRIAAAKMRGQSPAHTLEATALVNEAYLRLLGSKRSPHYHDSAHFFTAAAAAMRSILVDHARRKRAAKRGEGAIRVTLHPDLAAEELTEEHVLQVHEALTALATDHERPARVVELLFFAGLSVDEAANALGISDRTVKRDWSFARAWLQRSIEG